MYWQVLIDEPLQRILWRNSDAEELRIFELATVTYGTSLASFLAIRSLQEIANIERDNMPVGAARILSDFLRRRPYYRCQHSSRPHYDT